MIYTDDIARLLMWTRNAPTSVYRDGRSPTPPQLEARAFSREPVPERLDPATGQRVAPEPRKVGIELRAFLEPAQADALLAQLFDAGFQDLAIALHKALQDNAGREGRWKE